MNDPKPKYLVRIPTKVTNDDTKKRFTFLMELKNRSWDEELELKELTKIIFSRAMITYDYIKSERKKNKQILKEWEKRNQPTDLKGNVAEEQDSEPS